MIVVIGLISSCQLNSLEEPIIIADIQEEFKIEMQEVLTSGVRPLQFIISSIETEDCLNFTITTPVTKVGNKIGVSIQEIIQPDDCQIGHGPAIGHANLGLMTGGIFDLTVDLKNTVFNDGQLTFSDDIFQIKLFSQTGLKLPYSELIKLPDNLAWGYINYQNSEQKQIANQFYGDLTNYISPVQLRVGNYGYFRINDQGNIIINNKSDDNHSIAFIGLLTGDKNELQELVSGTRQKNEDQVFIELITTSGEEF